MTEKENAMVSASREELSAYLELRGEIDRLNRKEREIRLDACASSGGVSAVRGGKTTPAAARMTERLELLAGEREKLSEELRSLGTDIARRMRYIRNPVYRRLLWARYIDGMSLKAACMQASDQTGLHYSYDHIRHLSAKALLAYAKASEQDKIMMGKEILEEDES